MSIRRISRAYIAVCRYVRGLEVGELTARRDVSRATGYNSESSLQLLHDRGYLNRVEATSRKGSGGRKSVTYQRTSKTISIPVQSATSLDRERRHTLSDPAPSDEVEVGNGEGSKTLREALMSRLKAGTEQGREKAYKEGYTKGYEDGYAISQKEALALFDELTSEGEKGP